MMGRGEKGDAREEEGWFVTVDGNAHVERHVRRRRRGGRVRGKVRRGATGHGGRRGAEGTEGVAFGPGAHRGMLY